MSTPAPDTDTEQPLWLPCSGEHLLAVLHPAAAATGVVVVVGGPQYRAGSHRQFVLLARALAAAGFPVLRFDLRGMGDSTGRFPGFEHCDADIAAAIDGLVARQPQVRRVVLWGLCDGASAALLYLQRQPGDGRVAGLCLLNPWVRSAQTLAQARVQHYYRQRLADPAFWKKLLSGGVSWRAPLEWLRARITAQRGGARSDAAGLGFQQRMRIGLEGFLGHTLLVLSGRDLTAQEFEQLAAADSAWQALLSRPGVQTRRMDDADHTFSDIPQQDTLFAATRTWLASVASEPSP
jgi:exosortase A-associated hydrolase 1